ncbi:MAG TPA: CapA family protein [Burkholderiales bacterium]|nr:CapA family protein [Burkholderiales bacterium]
MRRTLMLTGDVNLVNVADPEVPFARIAALLRGADALFGNLECCLYAPPREHPPEREGFYADPAAGRALALAGYCAVGTANNVNYGDEAILASLAELDRLGIAHTGSGADRAAARRPAIVERKGLRFGFLQRTSVYWPVNHEAGERSAGVAVLRGHTAWQLPAPKSRPDLPPMNRPGLPPLVVTWADREHLAQYVEEVAALRRESDIVVCSHHWGLGAEVLQYMSEIAHAAVEAGADVVMGHGPHRPLAIEFYRGRPVFYGLGNCSFHTGHERRRHGDWVGLVASIALAERAIERVALRLVRHNERNETVLRDPAQERATIAELERLSAPYGTVFEVEGEEVVVRAAAR